MKKILLLSTITLSTIACNGKDFNDGVMEKKGKVYTITTTEICNARGFHGPTPLKVVIKKNKIVNVEALPNRDTPRFFDRVKNEMLPKFRGVDFKDYATVDVVSGATISSKAVRENVKAAYDYYMEHK